MKKIFKYPLILSFAIVFGGCQDFEVIEKDPNRAVNAPASLVFNGVLNDMYNNVNGGSAWGDKARWNQFYCSNYNYYSNNEYTWTTTDFSFFTLKNVVKMEEEAIIEEDNRVRVH